MHVHTHTFSSLKYAFSGVEESQKLFRANTSLYMSCKKIITNHLSLCNILFSFRVWPPHLIMAAFH